MSRSGSGGHLASTFTDLMTSLMVIFILLFVANLNNAAGARRQIQKSLLAELRSELGQAGMDVSSIREDPKDPYAIVIILPDSSLFDRGQWQLRPSGERVLQTLVPRLSRVLCAPAKRKRVESLVVEGHTDATFVTGLEGTEQARDFNMVLSQKRSIDVVRASLAPLEGEGRGCIRSLMSASGRGQEELLPEEEADSERQRRVVLKIRVKEDVAQELAAGGNGDGRR